MVNNIIDYGLLVDEAMYHIVRSALKKCMNVGHLGEHHFFISFVTKYPGVEVSPKLLNKYPYEMTIVLQYQFKELRVYDDYFSVVLSFHDEKEKIVIPFAALSAFADPSVKFGLQFKNTEGFYHQHNDKPDLDLNSKVNKIQDTVKKPKKTKESKSNIINLDFKNKTIK